MIRVNVVKGCKLWDEKIKQPLNFFNRLVKYFPKYYKFKKKDVSLTVLLSNNKNIKKLNNKFRKKNKFTDILSFPFDQKPFLKKKIYLGDIIISYEFMNNSKYLKNIDFKNKVCKTFIHGFLHLLNYDHIKLKDFEKMNKKELKIYNLLSKKIGKFI